MENVTNMIGVEINGRPKIGVIHKPFVTKDGNVSKTYFGSVETGAYRCKNKGNHKKQLSYSSTKPISYLGNFEQTPVPEGSMQDDY
jgi:3'-phosphoadenosine 5'-phosphosulfate (PAPS) 3'-phosphatase